MGLEAEVNAENAEKWMAKEFAPLINQCLTEIKGEQETAESHELERDVLESCQKGLNALWEL